MWSLVTKKEKKKTMRVRSASVCSRKQKRKGGEEKGRTIFHMIMLHLGGGVVGGGGGGGGGGGPKASSIAYTFLWINSQRLGWSCCREKVALHLLPSSGLLYSAHQI